MPKFIPATLFATLFAAIIPLTAVQAQTESPSHWKLAPTPPMGWNSYDAYGASVTEAEMLVNAAVMKEKLLPHGWNILVVDYRWSDPEAATHSKDGIGSPLTMDSSGRLLPSPNRFPSANDGNGFKGLADKVHAMGLKFGIHVMRGIPRQAVAQNTPIEGSAFHAADAANTNSTCSWCKDMYGVDGTRQAGQDYYDSLFRLYASWGVDFVKVDDLSRPYSTNEIEAVRKAIDKCSRPMIFSTSPGETPVKNAKHISLHANMWRVSDDFWDNWESLNHAFDLAAAWQQFVGPGHWADSDMIPFGKLSLENRCVGNERMTRFTPDEQVTLISLWSLLPSPLMLGGSLVDMDSATLALLTNDEVLAVNQDPLGQSAKWVVKYGNGREIWCRSLADGSKVVGLFNRGETPNKITLQWEDVGMSGECKVRDLWQKKDLGNIGVEYSCTLPRHGAIMLKLTPVKK